jgi:hypothetical protein
MLVKTPALLPLQYGGGYQRTGSPGLILRDYKSGQYAEDISRIYTYSYLTEEPTQGYLKRPIDPYDKPPTSPHFHRPSCECYGVWNVPAETCVNAGATNCLFQELF